MSIDYTDSQVSIWKFICHYFALLGVRNKHHRSFRHVECRQQNTRGVFGSTGLLVKRGVGCYWTKALRELDDLTNTVLILYEL